MQGYNRTETVAAIATPAGEGGVAIVRISGGEAVLIGDRLFSGNVTEYQSHTAHYGKVLSLDGETIDSALLLVMGEGRSYTGDTTVEIQCHGGPLIARRVLEAAIRAGARAAQPGEFTYRAFMNGKIDLAQAEAVQAVITAKNERAVDAASNQLQGRLSNVVGDLQRRMIDLLAILEAWVDFPEDDLEFTSFDEMIGNLEAIQRELERLVATFHDGRLLQEGISLCLVGAPNVGKSSLMNVLLDKDRAIVTPIAGTTRDLLEDATQLNGLHLKLIDTAGIRETEEIVEKEGIRRSRQAIEEADLVLVIFDASKGADLDLLDEVPHEKAVIVWNKTDLAEAGEPEGISVSAKEGRGIEALKEGIDQKIWKKGPPSREEVWLTNVRHKEAVDNGIDGCRRTIEGLKGRLSPEFICLDLREGVQALNAVTGVDLSEEVLTAIFSKFCLGK